MIDQLMQMIQQSGQQSVVENSEVPNENNDAILNEAQQSITSGLQGLASTGELNTLMESTNDPQQVAAHPAVQNISNNFMGSIMEKFGLSKGTAATIAASIIPMVIGKMMNKGGQQGGGGFDLGGLLSSLTGGNAAPAQQGQPQQQSGGGIMDTLSNLGAKFGLDKDGDGDVDMSDLSKLIK
jgi:uncharacterized protein YidB (DUF937 family)